MTAAIAGILRHDGAAPDRGLVRRMLEDMCPAGCAARLGVAADGPVAMGSIRLDPAGNPTPPGLWQEGASIVALDLALHDPDRLPASQSVADADRAVARHLASADADGLAQIHGDFAIAAWDGRTGRLTIYRDRFGARPICTVHRRGAYTAFATLSATLRRVGLAGDELDDVAIASLAGAGSILAPRTHFAEIRQVPAAHRLRVGPEGPKPPRRYWQMERRKKLPLGTDRDDLAAELRRQIERAVRRRLPESGVVATHLSGGVDSSSISAIAAMQMPVIAYAMTEPDADGRADLIDETPYVHAVAAAYPRLKLCEVHTRGLLARLEGTDPYSTLSISPDRANRKVFADAAGLGASVLLTGVGGDEAASFTGVGAHAELFWSGAFRRLIGELRAVNRYGAFGLWRQFQALVIMQSLPPGLRERLRRWRRGRHHPFVSGVSREVFVQPAFRPLIENAFVAPSSDTVGFRLAMLNTPSLPARLTEDAISGMETGVACAHPLLDLDLLDFVVRVPSANFLRDGVYRALFRDAMVGVLPDPVRLREDKFVAFPDEDLRLAKDRREILARLESLAENPVVTRVVDVHAIIAEISARPNVEETSRLMREWAAAGVQYSTIWPFASAIGVALFLEAQSTIAPRQNRETRDKVGLGS